MNIIIDDRESAVIPFINIQKKANPGITSEVKRINIGDYALCHGSNIKAIIERKTWRDLAASIRDGRKKNVNKLIKLRSQTNCKIIYLIEGNATPTANRSYGRIPYKVLISHLNHLIFRDDIHIIYSKDQEYTAYKLFELCNNYLTLDNDLLEKAQKNEEEQNKQDNDKLDDDLLGKARKELLEKAQKNEEDLLGKARKNEEEQDEDLLGKAQKNEEDLLGKAQKNEENRGDDLLGKAQKEPQITNSDSDKQELKPTKPQITNSDSLNEMYDFVNELWNKDVDKLTEKQTKETDINMALLLCIPGIGFKTAEVLHSNNLTLYKIYHKYIEYGKIGIKEHKEKCIESFKKDAKYNKDHNVKILSLIPQVSKKTAQLILTKTSLHNIFTQKKESEKLISEIKKTEKRKIGKIAAANIIKYLTE
jgi:ERCC4-type nuclease